MRLSLARAYITSDLVEGVITEQEATRYNNRLDKIQDSLEYQWVLKERLFEIACGCRDSMQDVETGFTPVVEEFKIRNNALCAH